MRTILILALLIPATAGAQTMFKCKGADGVTTYQQTQCEDDASTVDARHVAREADSRGPAYRERRPEPSNMVIEGGGYAPAGRPSNADELMRKLAHRHQSLSAISGKSEVDNRRRVDIMREINEIEAQLRMPASQPAQPQQRRIAQQPVYEPAPRPAERPIIRSRDMGFGNKKYLDQHGNVYHGDDRPGTNKTLVRDDQGKIQARCVTDAWGNEKCR